MDETAKPNSNIEEIVKERKKVKVKKKVLVKKAKGEKTVDPLKKDLLGNIKLFIQIQNKNIFIQTNRVNEDECSTEPVGKAEPAGKRSDGR